MAIAQSSAYAGGVQSSSCLIRDLINRRCQEVYADRFSNVAVYGSARPNPGDSFYMHGVQVGEALGRAGLNVGTGGGQGAMKAVAQGAAKTGAHTIGFAMPFIGEQPSADCHQELYVFNNFQDRLSKGFGRRTALTAAVPGGLGTLMEITTKATELATNKTMHPDQKQIVLFDKDGFYREFLDFLDKSVVSRGFMSRKDLDMFKLVRENEIDKGAALLKSREVPYTSGLACNVQA